MHVALVLLLCCIAIHSGVSQVLPTVLTGIDTVTATPLTQRCEPKDQLAFTASLPNGVQCASGIGTLNKVTTPYPTPAQVTDALANVCNNDCGGIYSKYLESSCKDPNAAEAIRITCTPTNGSAIVGEFCYYAVPNISLDSQIFNELSSCDNVTSDSSCTPDCRETLIKIKTTIGCCLQNVYNNTKHDVRQFLDTGFLTQSQYNRLKYLTDPDTNPWKVCAIEPPESCGAPSFKPPAPPTCTRADYTTFLSSLPSGAVCGESLANASVLTANDTTELTKTLDIVCTKDCGGAYIDFLKNTCNDHFTAEVVRTWCIRTNGSAASGPYCSFASDAVRLSYLAPCSDTVTAQSCSASCSSVLHQVSNLVGCCYQDILNNTFFYQQLVLNGIITPVEFTQFTEINNPFGNPWTFCDVPVPSKCPEEPLDPSDSKYYMYSMHNIMQ